MELYCTGCKRHYQTDGMTMVVDWNRSRKKSKTALYLDRKNGTTHEFLNEADSHARMPKPVEPVTSLRIPKQAGEQQPQAPKETSTVVDLAEPESGATTTEAGVNDVVAVNPAHSNGIEDTSVVGDSEPFEYGSWVPDPSDWYECSISSNGKSSYTFATLSNGEDVYIEVSKIQNMPHQHHCRDVVKLGDPISIRIQKNDHPSSKWKALEAWLQGEYMLPDEETATVQQWDERKGMVERLCGCWVFVSSRTPYDFNLEDPVIVSGWATAMSKEHPGQIAMKIRPQRDINTLPLEDAGDDVIRI